MQWSPHPFRYPHLIWTLSEEKTVTTCSFSISSSQNAGCTISTVQKKWISGKTPLCFNDLLFSTDLHLLIEGWLHFSYPTYSVSYLCSLPFSVPLYLQCYWTHPGLPNPSKSHFAQQCGTTRTSWLPLEVCCKSTKIHSRSSFIFAHIVRLPHLWYFQQVALAFEFLSLLRKLSISFTHTYICWRPHLRSLVCLYLVCPCTHVWQRIFSSCNKGHFPKLFIPFLEQTLSNMSILNNRPLYFLSPNPPHHTS